MLETKINSAREELHLPMPSMKKKNQLYIEIDETIQKDPSDDERGPSDSSITQKIGEKKLNSIKTSIAKPRNVKSFNVNPYSPRKHSTYYISEAIRAIN